MPRNLVLAGRVAFHPPTGCRNEPRWYYDRVVGSSRRLGASADTPIRPYGGTKNPANEDSRKWLVWTTSPVERENIVV
jgi:hypothetical protein